MNIFVAFAAMRGIAIGLFAPIWILYLGDQGFDLLAIGLFGTVFEIAKFVFEIPSGTFADKSGVRRALFFSYLLSIVTWALFPFLQITWICVLAMIVWALAEALVSGAFETWMSYVVPKEEFGKYLMRNTQVLLIFIILVSLISGHLYKFNNYLPFYLVAAVYAVMVVFVVVFVRVKPNMQEQSGQEQETFLQIMKKSFQIVMNHRRVLNVVLAGFFAALAYDVFARYWQPYLNDVGIPAETLGYVMAGAGAVAFFLLQITVKLNKWIEKRTLLSMVVVEVAGVLLLLSTAIGLRPVAMGSTTLFLALEDIRNPIVNSYLNKFFPDSYKATMFSINSGVGAAGEILSGIIFGLIAVKFGLTVTFVVAALFLLPTLFLYRGAARTEEGNSHAKAG